jgi:hypothetical protein
VAVSNGVEVAAGSGFRLGVRLGARMEVWEGVPGGDVTGIAVAFKSGGL